MPALTLTGYPASKAVELIISITKSDAGPW